MLSENLARIRKEKGLTQEALAVKLNVVRQTVSKWEKGTVFKSFTILQAKALSKGKSTNVFGIGLEMPLMR